MKYIRQFGIILLITFIGEIMHELIPIPVPAGIYGIVLLFTGLKTGIVPLSEVKDASKFLIQIMPLMFIPAAVGLIDTWEVLSPSWLQFVIVTVVTTVVVMAVSGLAKQMSEFLSNSAYFGVLVSLVSYWLGAILKKKFKSPLINPLLISIVLTIPALLLLHIDYSTYYEGAKYLAWLLTPATVALAVPLYEQFDLLKHNAAAVIVGILAGVLSSLGSVLGLAALFGFSHEEYITFLPKSITTAIGMGVSEELGGIVSITAGVIIITGVLGNILAEVVLKVFRITEPVAKGIALGTSAHAIGTAKAMELGEAEGAMSSLSIAVSGIITVAGAALFANLY